MMVGLYGVVPCWKDGRRGQGAFRTVWAGCCGAGRVCEFPQRAGCRRSGNLPLESASVAAGGPACLARPVALARSHAIAPPWAPPRPDGRRPAWAYMRASKTYGAAERPATASAGRRLQACQPTRCRQPARLGPSTGAIIHLRSRIPVPHGGFHGYDHNPRTRPLPWKPSETAPRAQPRGPLVPPAPGKTCPTAASGTLPASTNRTVVVSGSRTASAASSRCRTCRQQALGKLIPIKYEITHTPTT